MADSEKSTSRKFPVIVLAGIVVVLVAGAAGTWLFMHRGAPATGGAAIAAAKAKPAGPPVFFKLDPFTVNLRASDDSGQLLYVGITVEVGDEATKSILEQHLPQVRNRMLMVLSGQDATTLVTSEGKQRLAASIHDAIVQPFDKAQPAIAVGNVLFTQFIVQ